MDIALNILNGDQKNEKIFLEEGVTISIGREYTCDFRLSNPNVSRVHCTIYYKDGELWLEDAKSYNGTLVNDTEIKETSLLLGDIVQLGPIRLQVIEYEPSFNEFVEDKERKEKKVHIEQMRQERSEKRCAKITEKTTQIPMQERPTETERLASYDVSQETKQETQQLSKQHPADTDKMVPYDVSREINLHSGKAVVIATPSVKESADLEKRLQQEGFHTIQVEDGHQAFDNILRYKPALVIAEARLPIMDGWGLSAAIKKHKNIKNTPLLLITSFSEIDERLQTTSFDTVDFLSLPLQLEEVVTRAHLAIKKAQLEKGRSTRRLETAGIEGNLAIIPLADLLATSIRANKNGELTIEHQDFSGKIFFENGEIINAENGCYQGKIALIELLSWKEGHFYLEEKQPESERLIFKESEELIQECISLLDSLKKSTLDLANPEQKLRINFRLEFFEWGMEATPRQIAMLSQICEHDTVLEIIQNSETDALAGLKTILFLLEKELIFIATSEVNSPDA